MRFLYQRFTFNEDINDCLQGYSQNTDMLTYNLYDSSSPIRHQKKPQFSTCALYERLYGGRAYKPKSVLFHC